MGYRAANDLKSFRQSRMRGSKQENLAFQQVLEYDSVAGSGSGPIPFAPDLQLFMGQLVCPRTASCLGHRRVPAPPG